MEVREVSRLLHSLASFKLAISLTWNKQKSGKAVNAWAFRGDCDPAKLESNTCEIEWPPRSGHRLEISEVDRGRWFSMSEADEYIREEQREFLRWLLQ